MKRLTRFAAALAVVAGGLWAGQAPASAVAQAAVLGGGWLDDASGPGTSTAAVTGTISGTMVGTFGTCSFSVDFVGQESLVQGQGSSIDPIGCWVPCLLHYQRLAHEIVMQGPCGWGGSFQAGGFVEPTSALPTNTYLFQVAGTHPSGPIAIQGNIAFTPGAPIGVDPGDPLPVPTGVHFSGTMTGVIGNTVGSCSFAFDGFGFEGVLTGQSVMSGPCNGSVGWSDCDVAWVRVGTHTMLTGSCAGALGGTLIGMGELILTGSSFTFVGEITVI